MRLADVALPVPLPRPFAYEIPDALSERAIAGARVLCTLGTRRTIGVIIQAREGDPPENVKPLLSVFDGEPAVPADLLAFLRDLSSYYLAPIGEVMRLALPPIDRETARMLEEPQLFA